MDKIEIKKKQGSIVEALRDAILSGSIPADTEMTQNELAQSLGVSRMPVREALIILEYQGLIRRLPNNHVRVVPCLLYTSPSPRDLSTSRMPSSA